MYACVVCVCAAVVYLSSSWARWFASVILVSLDSPYDIEQFVSICIYSAATDVSLIYIILLTSFGSSCQGNVTADLSTCNLCTFETRTAAWPRNNALYNMYRLIAVGTQLSGCCFIQTTVCEHSNNKSRKWVLNSILFCRLYYVPLSSGQYDLKYIKKTYNIILINMTICVFFISNSVHDLLRNLNILYDVNKRL